MSDMTPAVPQRLPFPGSADTGPDGYGPPLEEMPIPDQMVGTQDFQQISEADPFDSLVLEEDDILLDEIDSNEIQAFNEQTAITDVSDIAQEMTTDAPEEDLPPDLLEEIDLPELSPNEVIDNGAELFQLDAEPERATAWPTIQSEAQPPICLQARPQPEPSQPSQWHPLSFYHLANTLVAPLELAACAPW